MYTRPEVLEMLRAKYKDKVFTVKLKHGEFPNCTFEFSTYEFSPNKQIALIIWNNVEGFPEPLAKATVYATDIIDPTWTTIKNWSENEGMFEWLIDNDIVEPLPLVAHTNFGIVPIAEWKL